MGRFPLTRGEIRWYNFRLADRRRPVLVLTRDEVIDRLNEIIVAPVRGGVLRKPEGTCRPPYNL
jgi:mRNA-degrading endonuclease toxin of MazEF toxin-antitoxin module